MRRRTARADIACVSAPDSNVHTDVARLEQLGLIERNEDAAIWVPYEAVEIVLPLAQVA